VGPASHFLIGKATFSGILLPLIAMAKLQSVLIAEDSDDDLYLMRRAFSRAALPNSLIAVRDGVEAIAYLNGEGPYADRAAHPLPALILLDIKMPRSSGLEVLEWIRDQADLKKIPVLILSSSNQARDKEAAKKLGADGYFVKPTSFDELVALVKRLNSFLKR
jgi:CheY-like chemotaxis protein